MLSLCINVRNMAILLQRQNTKIIPKTETKLSGWVRDTQKAYKQYINNKPSTMIKEQEELLKAANFPFNYPTSTNRPSENSEKKVIYFY
jgi:hypothetical protein